MIDPVQYGTVRYAMVLVSLTLLYVATVLVVAEWMERVYTDDSMVVQ